MKKTLTPRIIPQDKEGWSKGDLLLQIDAVMSGSDSIDKLSIANYEYQASNPYHEAQQVILCGDSAMNIVGEWAFDSVRGCFKIEDIHIVFDHYPVIIASHPQLPNTLPISPETLQAIAECGGECAVICEQGEFMAGAYVCKCRDCGAQVWNAAKRWYLCADCSTKYPTDPSGCIVVDVVRNEAVDKPKITFDTGVVQEAVIVGCWTDLDMLAAAQSDYWSKGISFAEWLTEYKNTKNKN